MCGPYEAYNDDMAAQIRRCGRAAGRRLGYKVRTFASDPEEGHNGRRVVYVVVTESNTQDDERVRDRSALLISETMTRILG